MTPPTIDWSVNAVAAGYPAPVSAQRLGPWRTGAPDRPAVAAPPRRMPARAGRRPLKRWRYVGAYGPEVMVCAAVAHVGPLPVSWWAVWDREHRTLAENTVRRRGPVVLGPGRVRVEDGPVSIDLSFDEGPGVETISPHGDHHIWTRKQAGIHMRGTVAVAERSHDVDACGMVDDSAGYHARRTAWIWSAGVGTTEDGTPVAWNLVTGVHDAPRNSERTIWIGGEPRETGPVAFAADLTRIDFADGGALSFSAEATRARRENLLLLASSYEQPFGTFAGELPGAGRLREGWGVMERHDVKW